MLIPLRSYISCNPQKCFFQNIADKNIDHSCFERMTLLSHICTGKSASESYSGLTCLSFLGNSTLCLVLVKEKSKSKSFTLKVKEGSSEKVNKVRVVR
jgi:hypothetical protein